MTVYPAQAATCMTKPDIYENQMHIISERDVYLPKAPTLLEPPQTSNGSPKLFRGTNASGSGILTPKACARPAAAVVYASGIVDPASKE